MDSEFNHIWFTVRDCFDENKRPGNDVITVVTLNFRCIFQSGPILSDLDDDVISFPVSFSTSAEKNFRFRLQSDVVS